MRAPKALLFWPLLLTVLLTDCVTKRIAEDRLAVADAPHPVLGDVVRFSLAYNPGAALSLSLGSHSRWALSLIAVSAIAALAALYRRTVPGDRVRVMGIALVAGGALGNLLDRMRSPLGVVDFIDIGVGATRFWTFNVADAGIVVGIVLLAFVLARPAPEPLAGAAAAATSRPGPRA